MKTSPICRRLTAFASTRHLGFKLPLPSQLSSFVRCTENKPHSAVARSFPVNDLLGPPQAQRPTGEDAGLLLGETIGPGLELIAQAVDIEGQQFNLIVPQSSDAVCDYYIDSGRMDRDPYWCRPWPSAIALAQLLIRRPDLVRRKRVCEVGAGLGIAGTIAAKAGASAVLLTDREDLALECALRSAEANGLSVRNLEQPADIQDEHAEVQSCHLDWTAEDPGVGRFDVVLACDVIYEHAAVAAIANLIPKLLNTETGTFILADPESRTRHHRQEIVDLLLRNKKFSLILEASESAHVTMDGIETDIRLMIFKINAQNDTIGVKSMVS